MLILIWAAKSTDSPIAAKIRQAVGIKAIAPEVVVPPPVAPEPVVVVAPEPIPEPVPVFEPEPVVIPEIDFSGIARQRNLWPKSLKLKNTKKVPIRYQEQDYGFMEFKEGLEFEVIALKGPSEVYCSINGNFLSLSADETNFSEWFENKYSDRYKLQPSNLSAMKELSDAATLDTEEGQKHYLSQMRIWCHQNYESIGLEIQEHTLVFKWLPKEDAPVSYQLEAREIARKYLILRSELGGQENYAACEIRHPVTDELLGASSIFIPRIN